MEGSPSICASQILYEHPQRTTGRQQLCHASNDVVFLFPAPYCALQQEFPLHSLPVPRGCNYPAASCKGNCSPPNLPAWLVRALLQLRLLGDAICHVNSSTRRSHLLLTRLAPLLPVLHHRWWIQTCTAVAGETGEMTPSPITAYKTQ